MMNIMTMIILITMILIIDIVVSLINHHCDDDNRKLRESEAQGLAKEKMINDLR